MTAGKLWLLVLVWSGAACPADGPFTLEQILSSPFPSELVAAPSGARLAWVMNDRGVRNIWVAEGPDFKSRAVTRYTADDGQEISSLRWARDALVFVRGSDANRQGEYPNPTSDPAGTEQALWVVPLAGGEPRRLDEGHSPAVSPAGDRVAYIKQQQVWHVRLEGDAKPEPWVRTRGRPSALRWSPDGSKLAFVVHRDDHSFIAIYDLASKRVHYLDPSTDFDGNPAWSRDGRRVAWIRIPFWRELQVFGPKRSAEPWSIHVAEAATGEGRPVWRAQPGRGSVFSAVAAENQLFWAAGDLLVFPWERDGWKHLYAVPAAGGEARPLTRGAFEVEHVALSPDRRTVLYSSNQDDIDRRHIWRVEVASGRAERLTHGRGIEWTPVMTADGAAVAFLRSDARRPARPAVLTAGTVRDLAPEAIPATFPERALVEPQPVTFAAADGMEIPAQLFLPAGIRAGERRPAIVYLHGGSRRQMLLGWHYLDYYHHAYALNQYLASRGFVVLSVNYRSGTGYGMEFREALHYGARGASELQDVLGAGLYLRSRPDVDPKRIGLWGGSYGGYLTALALARASDLFACGVDLHGVHDWRSQTRLFVDSDELQTRERALRVAFESSPLAYVHSWRSPVLLIHGDDDRNVDFRQTVELVEALRRHGVEFEQLVLPDEVHGFLRHENWLKVYRAAAGFFERRLGAARRP
ncbi:MAG: S9 family peptidase [Bryobacterales bacterium]|nr:S9 family peptidase [Bryobacteraceae bacterium]MDW8353065.1 S9 family peptidase [Bryobacterales bacterium]